MNWVSFIGYSFFPLSGKGFDGTVQDIFHFYVITLLVVISSIASLIILFISGVKNRKTSIVGMLAIIALAFMFIGPVGTGLAPKEYFGLLERFSTFSVVIYTGVLGIYGFAYQGEND
jgi:hypothetical protein